MIAKWFYIVAFWLTMAILAGSYVYYAWLNPGSGPCDDVIDRVQYASCVEDEKSAGNDVRPY